MLRQARRQVKSAYGVTNDAHYVPIPDMFPMREHSR